VKEQGMQQMTRVVLALDAPEVLEELLHFLDRSGVAHVVATAGDQRQLGEATRQLEPDLVIAEPRLAPHVPSGVPCVAVASRETVGALRAAIDAGVRGFNVWPVERDDLLERVRGFAAARRTLERRATMIAVHGSRGGAGCTFLATHLAQAMVAAGRSCILVDVDLVGGDVGAALGVPEEAGNDVPTLRDLGGVIEEMNPGRFVDAVWSHPSGFSAIFAPPPGPTDEDPDNFPAVVDMAAASVDVVVLHTAQGLDAMSRASLSSADLIVETLCLDVLSFRASTRVLAHLAGDDVEERVRFVVNRASRAEIVPADVTRVFGRPPIAVVPYDGSVHRLQDHGRLLATRSRCGRAIANLAERLLLDSEQVGSAA
jgi:Flp pilus assembly CpaE family ATPase